MIKFLRILVNGIWTVAIVAVLVLGTYVSLGRVMMPQLHQYQVELEDYLSDVSGVMVEIGQLQGSWENLQPKVTLQDVILVGDEGHSIALRELELQLDVLTSIADRQPVFVTARASGVTLSLVEQADGQWQLPGFSSGSGGEVDQSALLSLLWSQGHIRLEEMLLQLHSREHEQLRVLGVKALDFRCVQQFCSSQAELSLSAESDTVVKVRANLQGLPGTPDFSGDSYLELSPALALEEWLPLSPVQLPVAMKVSQLHAGGQFWLSWQNGRLRDAGGELAVPKIRYQSDDDAPS